MKHSDLIERTPDWPETERFISELGDALVRHARTLPAQRPADHRRRMPRVRRRLALATVAGGCAAVGLLVGLDGKQASGPTTASAASIMHESADALAAQGPAELPADAYSHQIVDVTWRERWDEGHPFEYETTERWERWQMRDGSGRERVSPTGPVGFPTRADRRAWVEAGFPDLTEPPSDRRLAATPRPFVFGFERLSYAQLEALPSDPHALGEVLDKAAEHQRDGTPELGAFDDEQARAYLLFTLIRDSFKAPAPPDLRATLYELMAETSGLRLEGEMTDEAGRSGTGVSVVIGDGRFVLLVDPVTGALLETQRIVLRQSEQFAGLRPGRITRATYIESGLSASVNR